MRWFIASIIITSGLALPASFLLVPIAFRHKMISQLDSPVSADREAALRFVRLRAGKDPAVLQATLAFLAKANPADIIDAAHQLERAKVWTPAIAGDALWLRWIDALTQDKLSAQRENAATLIAELPAGLVNHDAISLLTKLAKDEEIGVRYQALLTAAALVGRLREQAGGPELAQLREIVSHMAMRETPELARRATLLAAFTGGLDFSQLQPTDDESLILARRWAQTLNPAQATLPDASRDRNSLQYTFANYIAVRGDDDASLTPANFADALTKDLEEALHDNRWSDLAAARRLQRLILCDPTSLPNASRSERLDSAIARFAAMDANDPALQPITLAAINRLGAKPAFSLDTGEVDWLVALAWLESPREPVMRWKQPVPGRDNDLPNALQLAIIRAAPGATADELLPLLAATEPHVRDLACVTVLERFNDDDSLKKLVRSSLLNYSDEAKQSGAVLSGLTGVGGNVLKTRAELEDIWTVLQIMRLGLWLQGKQSSLDGRAADFWMRKDIPKCTLLYILLHRDPRTAFNLILHPRGEPLFDVIDLLNTRRWWAVLSRHLPADAPPFWAWADPDFQAFQLDTLRAWYIVNGHRMDNPLIAPRVRSVDVDPPNAGGDKGTRGPRAEGG